MQEVWNQKRQFVLKHRAEPCSDLPVPKVCALLLFQSSSSQSCLEVPREVSQPPVLCWSKYLPVFESGLGDSQESTVFSGKERCDFVNGACGGEALRALETPQGSRCVCPGGSFLHCAAVCRKNSTKMSIQITQSEPWAALPFHICKHTHCALPLFLKTRHHFLRNVS